jgi:hypothetical protein
MHPLNNKRHSTINHIGNMQYDRASRCPCKNGPVCRHCNYCSGCSCRCHTFFTLNFRFFKREDELKLLHRVKLQVGREELEAAEEAEKRLSMAGRGRYVDVGTGGLYGLHCMDVIVDPESVHALVEEVDETMSQDESEPEHDPPSPSRKSCRKLEDNLEQMETSPDSDDAASGDAGEASLTENGMQINVRDMKVTIRCQPGAFAKGPGIDHIDLTTFAGVIEGGSADCADTRSKEDTGSNELNESDGMASVDDDVGDNDTHSGTTPKVQVDGSSDTDTEPDSEAQSKGEEGGLNDDSVQDKAPAAKTRINSGRWTDEERERLRIALIKEPDMDAVVRAVGTRLFPAIRSYAPRTFPDLFEGLRERMQTNKPKVRRDSPQTKIHDNSVEAERPTRRSKTPESGPSRPTTRRASREAGNGSSLEEREDSLLEVKREENNYDDDEATSEDEEDEGADDSADSGKMMDRRPPPIARKSPLLALSSPSVRSKRSTLDLSGGRKRRSGSVLVRRMDAKAGEGDITKPVLSEKADPSLVQPHVANEHIPELGYSDNANPPLKRTKFDEADQNEVNSKTDQEKAVHVLTSPNFEERNSKEDTSEPGLSNKAGPSSKRLKVEESDQQAEEAGQKVEDADPKGDDDKEV